MICQGASLPEKHDYTLPHGLDAFHVVFHIDSHQTAMASHPFYPTSLQLEAYTPITLSLLQTLGVFFTGVAAIAGASYYAASTRPHIHSVAQRLVFVWFI